MKQILLIGLFIQLIVAQFIVKQCTHNQICVSCSTYEKYTTSPVKQWPRDMQICNRERSGKHVITSICCPTTLNGKECGTHLLDRISNGKKAVPFQFPWMALLKNKNGKFVCGGTLINSRFVLTAAHCVKREKIVSVRLGENDITQEEDCLGTGRHRDCADPPQNIKVSSSISHPRYDNRQKLNDIALLLLEWDATLSDSVQPICIPGRGRQELSVSPSRFYVSGWGLTETGKSFDVLRYAEVPPIPIKTCAATILRLNSWVKLGKTHVCAGGVNKVDHCQGDSGGPLQYISNRTRRYVQHGIVSFGHITCGKVNGPGVYTRIDQFIDWIHQQIG